MSWVNKSVVMLRWGSLADLQKPWRRDITEIVMTLQSLHQFQEHPTALNFDWP